MKNGLLRPISLGNSRQADGKVCELTPQRGLWYFAAQPKRPFKIPIPQNVIQRLETFRPRIITFSPEDDRNTPHSLAIMEHVRRNSTLLSKDKSFEVYLYDEQSRTTEKSASGQVDVAKN